MNCYIISYDLKNQRDYKSLREAIKAYGTWAHINDSTWAIKSDRSASQIRSNLKLHMDDDDIIFIVRSGHEAAWNNVTCTNEWLKKNL